MKSPKIISTHKILPEMVESFYLFTIFQKKKNITMKIDIKSDELLDLIKTYYLHKKDEMGCRKTDLFIEKAGATDIHIDSSRVTAVNKGITTAFDYGSKLSGDSILRGILMVPYSLNVEMPKM